MPAGPVSVSNIALNACRCRRPGAQYCVPVLSTTLSRPEVLGLGSLDGQMSSTPVVLVLVSLLRQPEVPLGFFFIEV